jgi:hypothetical protein
VVDVALLDDQFDDGGGGEGVEAAGGRVVEQQLGLADEGAGDGHAAAHSAGEAGREEVEGLLQLDKAQGIADAAVDFVVGNPLLNQLVGHVVADGERVEERALLKDHAGAGAQGKSCSSGMWEISSPKSRMLPWSGRSRPLTSLSRTLLPTPAGPSRMRVSPGATEKLTSSSTGGPSKAMETLRKTTTGAGVAERPGLAGLAKAGAEFAHSGGKRVSSTWVSRKSTKMMSTEAQTTA